MSVIPQTTTPLDAAEQGGCIPPQSEATRRVKVFSAKTREKIVVNMGDGGRFWRGFSATLETSGKLTSSIGVLLAFAARGEFVNYDYEVGKMLAFISGCFGTTGIVLSAFAVFALQKASRHNKSLKEMLSTFGIPDIPNTNQNFAVNPCQSCKKAIKN